MSGVDKIELPAGAGNPRMGWVSDVAAEMLRRLGIKYVSLNPGASYRGFHDSIVNYLGNRDPQMLLCLHEDHAVSIAHGYARATGEPMGCILHSNVGLMHGMMGIFNAWCNRVPMVVMGATGPVDAAIRRPWIDWIHTVKDQAAMIRNFIKWDDEPRSAEALVESMCRAVQMTRAAPRAPVYVCLDAGLQETALGAEVRLPDVARFAPPAPPAASAEQVARAADLLLAAKSPVILQGRGSRRIEDWETRIKLAELLGAAVITDPKTGATFPTEHPLHVGPPGGTRGPSKEAINQADVVLALEWIDLGGTFKLACGHKDAVKAQVISSALDSALHNGWGMELYALSPADLNVHAEADQFASQLLAEVERRLAGQARRWDGKPKAAATAPRAPAADAAPVDPWTLGLAIAALRERCPIAMTSTSIGWEPAAYPLRHPLDALGGDGGGGLGSSPGSAIGAALGLQGTGRAVVAVCGDGDFMQGATALWTAAHYRIPVLYVIWNNRSNFNDEVHQQTVAKDRGRPPENKWIGQRIDDPTVDLAGIARAQGVAAEGPVKTAGELRAALARGIAAVERGDPYLVDVHIEPGYAQPMITRASGEGSTGR